MGRIMSDYISLEESGVKEWHCFKKERQVCPLVEKVQRGKRVDGENS